jgi:hypothetical protein
MTHGRSDQSAIGRRGDRDVDAERQAARKALKLTRYPTPMHDQISAPPREIGKDAITMTTWLITGASRGFGMLVAEEALKRGDQVVASARSCPSQST